MEQKRDFIISLYDVYGGLLSDSCRDCTELYYCDDLSLSEIAENQGISRQGARDAIKRGVAELEHFESTLGLLAKQQQTAALASEIISATDDDKVKELAAKIISL